MLALVVALISVLVHARLFIVPIAPAFLPKDFSAQDPENVKWSVPVGNANKIKNDGFSLQAFVSSPTSPTYYESQMIQEISAQLQQYRLKKRKEEIIKEELWRAEAILAAEKQLAQRMKAASFDAEDLTNGCHQHNLPRWVLAADADAVKNGGINWSETSRIAGQINQIRHILGLDIDNEQKNAGRSISGTHPSDIEARQAFFDQEISNINAQIKKQSP